MLKNKVSNKEHEILSLMWDAGESLTAKQICDLDDGMIMSTVQSSLRSLLKRNLIKVEDVVFSGKSLSRSYVPTLNQEQHMVKQYDSIDIKSFMMAFFEEKKEISTSELESIEKLLDQARKSD